MITKTDFKIVYKNNTAPYNKYGPAISIIPSDMGEEHAIECCRSLAGSYDEVTLYKVEVHENQIPLPIEILDGSLLDESLKA